MKRKIVLRAAVRRDLAGIVEGRSSVGGADRTADYIAGIQGSIERVASHPELASDRSQIVPGLRKTAAGSHVIYFFFDQRSLRVARILHARQDAAAHVRDR